MATIQPILFDILILHVGAHRTLLGPDSIVQDDLWHLPPHPRDVILQTLRSLAR